MLTPHLDVLTLDGRSQQHQKVYFPDSEFLGSDGHRYELGRFIHKGSNGTLFHCADEEKAGLAVKFLHRLDDLRRARFEFEAQVLYDLTHPNILPYVDCADVETTHKTAVPFLVTEVFEGNLEVEVGRSGRLPISRVWDIGRQLCDGFGYLHSQGVIHRDVKPSNLLFRGALVAIGDLGLAKTHTDEGAQRFYRSDITLDNETVGPFLWMSPELVAYKSDKRLKVDHRSDLFQIGLVLWYLATGEIARGIIDLEDDPTGGALHGIVSRLLQQRAERRFQSADELANAIAGAQR